MMPSEDHPVIDKELTAENKEQDDSCDHFRGRLIEFEFTCDLDGSVAHERKEEGYNDHDKGIELCQPRHNDGGKASSSGGTGRDRMRASGYHDG